MAAMKKWGADFKIGDLNLQPARVLSNEMTVRETMEEMERSNTHYFPIKNSATGSIHGFATVQTVMKALAKRKANGEDPVSKVMTTEYRNMSSSMPLTELSRVLESQSFVFVDRKYIVSSKDVISFMKSKMYTLTPNVEMMAKM